MVFETPVIFHSQGVPLAGRFLRTTESLDERQPAVIVVGSWLTVKEQMALAYGRKLAESGASRGRGKRSTRMHVPATFCWRRPVPMAMSAPGCTSTWITTHDLTAERFRRGGTRWRR